MTQIGHVYAQGLYTLAKEEGLEKTIVQQLNALQQVFDETPEFLKLLAAPNLPKQERCGILDESFRGKVQPYVLNFLKILTEKGYIRYFSDCCREFQQQYNEDNGILPVQAVTAIAMTDAQKEKLTEKLSRITGKAVQLQCRVDPACLGGVRLDYDGKRVDGTVQNRLASISKLLQNTVL